MRGAVVESARASVRVLGDAGLRGDGEHLVAGRALLCQKRADHGFGHMRAIDIGGVDMRHPLVQRCCQNRVRTRFVGLAIKIAEGHRTDADSGNLRTPAAKLPLLHKP